MALRVDATAVTTVASKRSAGLVLDRKVRERLELATHRASAPPRRGGRRTHRAITETVETHVARRQPNCCAVLRLWQFAQRTSHFAISSSTRLHGFRAAIQVTDCVLAAGSR